MSENGFPHAVVTAEIPVRFAETDLMGVVHHSAYVVWFEVGRVGWMSAAGVEYTELSASGCHLAVTGIRSAYRASCTFGDTVRIATYLSRLRSRQLSFEYEIRHAETDALLVTGSSEHVCVDLEGRTTRLPHDIFKRLQAGARALSAI